MSADTAPPPLNAEQVREIRAMFARIRTPLLGTREHMPRLLFHSARSSRVACTCGAELGIVTVDEGLERVKAIHAEHIANVNA